MNISIFMCKKCSKLHERVLNVNSTSNSELNNFYYSNSIYDSNIQDYNNLNDLTIMKTFNNVKTETNNKSNDELQIIDYPYHNLNEASSFCSKTTIKKYNIDEKFNNSEKNTPQQITHPAKNIFNLFNHNNSQIVVCKKKINNLLINNKKGKFQNKFTNYDCYFLKKKNSNKFLKLKTKLSSNKFNAQNKRNKISNTNQNNNLLFRKNLTSKNKNILHTPYNKCLIKSIKFDSSQRSHKALNRSSEKRNSNIIQKKEKSNKNNNILTAEFVSKNKLILNKRIKKKSVNNFDEAKRELKLIDSAGNIKTFIKKKTILIKSKSSKIILPDTTHSSQMRKTKNIINFKTQKQLLLK